MIERSLKDRILKYLSLSPVTALLGPRQCGKSTLAKMIINEHPEGWEYLDPELFFNSIGGKKVCIDEIQLRPDLFSVIRAIVDESGRNGQLLILGSASPQLLKHLKFISGTAGLFRVYWS